MKESQTIAPKTVSEWAEQICEYYKQQAESMDRGGKSVATTFYTQSSLKGITSCQLLVFGINPGSECHYSEWDAKDKVNAEYLLNGNPVFHGKTDKEVIQILNGESKDSKGWALYKRLYSMLSCARKQDILQEAGEFALENLVLFGTLKEKKLPKEVNINECAKLSLSLIPILKPKVVVLLGAQCRIQFDKIQPLSPVVNGLVWSAEYEDTTVVAIPHTASRYTSEAICLCGKIIGLALDDVKITSSIVQERFQTELSNYEERKKKEPVSKNNEKKEGIKTKVLKAIKEAGFEAYDENNNRYKLDDTYGITVTDKGKGYVAIRRIQENKMTDNDTPLRTVLESNHYHIDQKAWVGYKYFGEFEGGDEKTIADSIIAEIKGIIADL